MIKVEIKNYMLYNIYDVLTVGSLRIIRRINMKYVVFTMDCISSKKVDNVTKFLEEKAYKLNNDQLRNQSFLTDFGVLVGD